VVVTQSFSLGMTNVTLGISTGAATYSNGITSWLVGDLLTNTVASLTVTGRVTRVGTMNVAAAAGHDLNDVFWGNNTAVSTVNLPNATTSNTLAVVLATRKLVYDAARDVIYASTPASNRLSGNLIATLDPATGAMKNALAAGSEPDQICLSDDSAYLYA